MTQRLSAEGAPPPVAPVAGARRTPRPRLDAWLTAAAVAVALAYVRVIWFTPTEATQGLAQKIYYLHLPAALNAYIAFGVVAVTSVVYLWLRDPRADRLAESSAEVGLLFTTVVLTTGPIWGKPIWGTWWTWDARLTLTLFLWFIYAGYLVLRGAVAEPEMRARYSAVLGILGALLIPFIHMSVYLFRTLHPMPIVLKPDRPSLPPEMLRTLLFSFAAFFLAYVALVRSRYGLAVERALLAERDGDAQGGD
jgi:heme exporter protein C